MESSRIEPMQQRQIGFQRVLLLLVFLTLAVSLALGLHLFLVQRLIYDVAFPPSLERVGLLLVIVLAGCVLLEPLAQRLLPRRLARWIAWPAAMWLGVAFLLVITLAVMEPLQWLLGAAQLSDSGPTHAARARAALAFGIAGAATWAALRSALRPPRNQRVEVKLRNWPSSLDGFRVVQISDIHVGPILGRRFARHLTERVNGLNPDMIAVTGDLVDGHVESLRQEVEPFRELRAPRGVFFVTGNHDYFSGVEAWVERARELGFRVLRNERITIGEGDASFELAGVEDHRSGLYSAGPGEDLPRALGGRDASRPLVLLAHDPSTFKAASRMGVDLQISGHTHGGQIWPFNYVVRLVIPWVAGLYRVGTAQLYVSRGTGFWGPPMRLFAPAEITELVIRRQTASPDSPTPA